MGTLLNSPPGCVMFTVGNIICPPWPDSWLEGLHLPVNMTVLKEKANHPRYKEYIMALLLESVVQRPVNPVRAGCEQIRPIMIRT